MAYDNLRERQRAVFLLDLTLPASSPMTHDELAFAWLSFQGFTQPTLLERLQAYAIDHGVSLSFAESHAGLI